MQASGSDKPITWLPLKRLRTDDWEKSDNRVLARLVAMAAGHPRTMAAVIDFVRDRDASQVVSDLRTIATKPGSNEDFHMTWSFLVPALTGKTMYRDDRFGDSTTFERAVAGGALQNACEDDMALAAQVPQPSLFALYAHAKKLQETASDLAAKCIVSIVSRVVSSITGFDFESVHAHWHVLIVTLFARRDEHLSLQLVAHESDALYRNAILYVGNPIHINCRVAAPSTPVLSIREKLSDVVAGEWSISDSIGVRELTLHQVVLPASSNEGFDMLVLHRTSTGVPHLLIIECKFSEKDSATILGWPDVQKKIAAVRKFLAAVFALRDAHPITTSGITTASQVTMLVVANRHETDSFVSSANGWLFNKDNGVRFNVGVVTRESLLAIYGELLRCAVTFNT